MMDGDSIVKSRTLWLGQGNDQIMKHISPLDLNYLLHYLHDTHVLAGV